MGWNPGQSLKSFAANQPPLLVFTVCLMSFGLTMVVLAYLIGENEIPNPDISMDWNKFLNKVAALQICIPFHYIKDVNSSNSELLNNSTHNSTFFNFVDQSKSMSAVLSNVVGGDSLNSGDVEDGTIVDISVKIPIWISGHSKVLRSAPSIVKGSIKGEQLGLSDKLASQEINMTFNFLPDPVFNCNGWCRIQKDVCLTIQSASILLPRTKSPSQCRPHTRFYYNKEASVEYVKEGKCKEGVLLHMEYKSNAELTEMLSMHERSIVNLHLMHTSYFMFVMVMTLICYALIKERYRSQKSQSLSADKIPLDA